MAGQLLNPALITRFASPGRASLEKPSVSQSPSETTLQRQSPLGPPVSRKRLASASIIASGTR